MRPRLGAVPRGGVCGQHPWVQGWKGARARAGPPVHAEGSPTRTPRCGREAAQAAALSGSAQGDPFSISLEDHR